MNRELSKTLKQEVPTRFNSVYTMLDSVNEMFDEVTIKLTTTDNIAYFANIKRKTLQSVCKQLKRFDDATKKLGVEKEETLHLVIPVLHELQTKLQKEGQKYRDDDEAEMSALRTELAKGVKEKCLSKLTWYHCAAAVLYPPYLSHPSLLSRAGEVARIRQDLHAVIAAVDTSNEINEQTGPPAKKSRSVLPDSNSEDSEDADENDEDRDADTGDEVDKYFNLTVDSYELSPLQFWKTQAASNNLPRLAKVARSVFAIPATQNKSERAFSAASHTLTDFRTRMDPEHVDELLLVRSHYKQIHFDTLTQL